MLLATKCPHCKTTFRVANDQLKLQAGLVRCGVCQQVFNGIEHLTVAGPNFPATAPSSSPDSTVSPVTTSAVQTAASVEPTEFNNPIIASELKSPSPVPETPVTEPPVAKVIGLSAQDLEFDLPGEDEPTPDAMARVEPRLETMTASSTSGFSFNSPVADSIIGTRTKAELEAEVQALLDADLQAESLIKPANSSSFPAFAPVEPTLNTPAALTSKQEQTIIVVPAFSEFDETHNSPRISKDVLLDNTEHDILLSRAENTFDNNLDNIDQLNFIRQAQNKRRSFWLLVSATLCMVVLLLAQASYLLRDMIAAMYPASKDTLVTLCSYAKCQIKLPAQIDALSYEADELHSLPHENTFELGLLLHNRSNLPQQWPNIELTLKNTQKQAILRRVFTPNEYLSNPHDIQTGFQSNQEQSVKMYFEVAQLKASDFVVAIFYP